MSDPADDFNLYSLTLIKGSAFGLAGASLIVFCQFAEDPHVTLKSMCGLVASIPMLAWAGLLAEMIHNSWRKNETRLQATVIVFFICAFALNLFFLGSVFWDIRPVFGIYFGTGLGIGYATLLMVAKLVKK
jgi:hypothetical protein